MISKTSRLCSALMSGEQLTARQIAARYRVANPRDLIYNLRNEGFDIDLISQSNSKGVMHRFYVMDNCIRIKRKAA